MFKRGVLKLEDLAPAMELTGTVLNVVDFGCFVNIGMHDSGLVHVSRLADRFIRDPHDVVAVGNIVKVWVVEIDKERRRVSLTMVQPGSERPKHPPRSGKPSHAAPAGEGEAPQGEHGDRQRPPRPAGQQRPPRPPRPAGEQRPPRPGGEQRPPRPPRPAGEQRPPRPAGDGRPPRPQGRGRPPYEQHRPIQQPRQAPKPVIPITEAMKKGKEPLRTFSDLMQFYQHKTVAPTDAQPPAAPTDAQPPVAAEPATVQETLPVDQPVDNGPVPSEPVVSESVAHEPAASDPVVNEASLAAGDPAVPDAPPADSVVSTKECEPAD